MTKSTSTNKPDEFTFEARWEKASAEPDNRRHESDTPIVVDLSIEHVLDRYVSFARKGVAQNRISPGVFEKLEKQTQGYKQALKDIDDGTLVKDLRDLAGKFNPFKH